MFMASFDQFLSVFSQVFQICLPQVLRIDCVTDSLLFQAIKTSPRVEWEFQFIPVPDLKNYNIMLGVIKVGQAF
jgi:hypothetical protein